MTTSKKKKSTWTDLNRNLADLDQHALLGLVQDLYAASKENKTFLHARFGLGGVFSTPAPLYAKTTASRAVYPASSRSSEPFAASLASWSHRSFSWWPL